MSLCGQQSLVKQEREVRTCVTMVCHSWLCPECTADRKAGLIANAHGGSPNTFLTLTCRAGQLETPNLAAAALARAWRILRLRIMRKYKITKLPFLAVIEAHKSGWPHLHILLRSIWLHQAWLSAQMADILNSPVVDIRRIDNKARVAAYVAAYCGKCAHKFGTAKRYWQSRDYDQRPPDANPKNRQRSNAWSISNLHLERWCTAQWYAGRIVLRLSARAAESRPDPRCRGAPP